MYQHILPFLLVGVFAAFSEDGCTAGLSNKGDAELSVSLTDAPAAELDRVKLTITGITVGTDKLQVKLPLKKEVVIDNLLAITGTNRVQLIPAEKLKAGQYDWIRLYISERNQASMVRERQGKEYPIWLDSNAHTGGNDRYLQLNQRFDTKKGSTTDIVLELDLNKALVAGGSSSSSRYYHLRPTLRLANLAEAGSIRGTVDEQLTQGQCNNDNSADEGRGLGNLVYVYQGNNSTLGDLYTDQMGSPMNHANPYATARVVKPVGESEYRYEVGFLPAGDYTVAFTCQGLGDHPLSHEELGFQDAQNVKVEQGKATSVDF